MVDIKIKTLVALDAEIFREAMFDKLADKKKSNYFA